MLLHRESTFFQRNWTILLVCALLVIQVALPLLVGKTSIGYDGKQYLQYARNIVQHAGYTYDGINPSCGRAPGYPLFLASFLWIFNSLTLIYPVQLLLLFAAYGLVARSFSIHLPGSWPLGILIFFVVLWPLNRIALNLMSEPLFIFLSSVGLFFLSLFLRDHRRIHLSLFVTAMTFSAYVRPISTLFVFFAVVVLLFARRVNWREATLSVILCATILAPWTYRNWKEFDRLIPVASTYGSVYYMTDQDEFKNILLESAGASHQKPMYIKSVGDDFELDPAVNDRLLQQAKKNIIRDPVGFLRRCVIKTVFVWSYLPSTKHYLRNKPFLFYAGIFVQLTFLATAIVGGRLLFRRRGFVVWPTSLFAVYHVMFLFPFYAESRYLVPTYIWLVGLTAYGLRTFVLHLRGHIMAHRKQSTP